jgi:chloramphenicol-sensitive protein RarD
LGRDVGRGEETMDRLDQTGQRGRAGRDGVGYGIAAYAIWGLFPLFWPLLEPASALEILASRVIWSFVTAVILSAFWVPRARWSSLLTRRNTTLLATASAVIAANWGVYIWAVNNGHVVEAALGYYINPILSISLGVLLLRERLTGPQWVSVGLATAAVVVLTVDYGHPPWISLALAASFATYGLIKNRLGAGAVETLTVETGLMTPLAVGYLIVLGVQGQLVFGHQGWTTTALLVLAGPITAAPLLLFAASATRVPLSTLGLLQYITPTLQFLIGVFYFGEAMSPARWVGFGLVWLALMVLTTHGLVRADRDRRRRSRPTEPADDIGSVGQTWN